MTLTYPPRTRQECQVFLSSNTTGNSVENGGENFALAGSNVEVTCKVICSQYSSELESSSRNLLKYSLGETVQIDSKFSTWQKGKGDTVESFTKLAMKNVEPQKILFTCKFNMEGVEEKYHKLPLTIREPKKPQFLNSDAAVQFDLEHNKGEAIVLDCWVEDTVPQISYQWSINNMDLDFTGPVLVVEKLAEVKDHSSDFYRCQVENSLGMIERNFTIIPKAQASTGGSNAGRLVALILGIVIGVLLALASLAIFVYWRLRLNNRRVRLKAMWNKYFAATGLAQLSDGDTSTAFTIVRPEHLIAGHVSQLSDGNATDTTYLAPSITSGQFDEAVYDRLEEIPYFQSAFEIDQKDLEFKEMIGRGAFGVVYKAFLRRPDTSERIIVAVKCVRDSYDATQYEALSSEIKLLTLIGHHLNIVNMVGAVTSKLKDGILYMVLDYCKGGNLRHFLMEHRERYFYSEDIDYFTLKSVIISISIKFFIS